MHNGRKSPKKFQRRKAVGVDDDNMIPDNALEIFDKY